jgi:predicted transcriptional regulator
MNLAAVERKFLQQLLQIPSHQAPITAIQPNPKTSAAERDRICRQLYRLGLVDYSIQIQKFAITPAGKSLLQLDMPRACLPVTPDEYTILKACSSGTITPQQLSLPPANQQPLLQRLANRDLIKIIAHTIDQVSLTPAGLKAIRPAQEPE